MSAPCTLYNTAPESAILQILSALIGPQPRFWTLRQPSAYSARMTKKIRVGVVFGGRSAEHEVSLQSAKNMSPS